VTRDDPAPALQLDSFLPYRLSVRSNTVSTAIAGAYHERFGLSIPEWRVLCIRLLRILLGRATEMGPATRT
jgi:hypothetical protein